MEGVGPTPLVRAAPVVARPRAARAAGTAGLRALARYAALVVVVVAVSLPLAAAQDNSTDAPSPPPPPPPSPPPKPPAAPAVVNNEDLDEWAKALIYTVCALVMAASCYGICYGHYQQARRKRRYLAMVNMVERVRQGESDDNESEDEDEDDEESQTVRSRGSRETRSVQGGSGIFLEGFNDPAPRSPTRAASSALSTALESEDADERLDGVEGVESGKGATTRLTGAVTKTVGGAVGAVSGAVGTVGSGIGSLITFGRRGRQARNSAEPDDAIMEPAASSTAPEIEAVP